tara:strand:- start:10687 stop:11568 length:882 start_codon:yes stop_codon:yes gene_type:complete
METFKKAIERAMELEHTPKFHAAGQGEPTLHPLLPEFADHMRGLGLEFGFTTNGSLMTEALSRRILEAGVEHIVFSISDMGDDYEEVYALKYDTTRDNILRFLDMNEAAGKPIRTQVSLVAHDLNRAKLDGYRKFWIDAGIDQCIHFEQTNRGGACDNGNYFVGNNHHTEQAIDILKKNNLSHVCGVPFILLFVGWNGQYYMCCNDYRKLTPLGSVFDYSIEEMDIIKRDKFFESEAPAACKNCDLDVINQVREALFEIEAGEAPASKLTKVTNLLRERQKDHLQLLPARETA